MRFGNREYRIALIVITLVFALPIVMHMINGLSSRMLADDYCFSAQALNNGLPGQMNFYYESWQGIFSATAAQGIVGIIGPWFNGVLPLLLIVGWWVGLIYLMWQVCTVLKFRQIRLSALALATLILYAILEGTPNVLQSIYWTSGSATYSLPMVLFTLWCCVILQIARNPLSIISAVIVGVIAGVIAGLLAGFSPIFAAFGLQVLVMSIAAVWLLRSSQKWPLTILLGLSLIGMLVGTVIIIVAPGNAVRQALFQKPSGLLALIAINLEYSAAYIGIDFSTFSIVPNVVLLVVGGWLISNGIVDSAIYRRVKQTPRKWLGGALGVALILLFGLFLPTSYNISGFPPGRALIIPHVITVALILVCGGVMALSLRKTVSGTGQISKVMIIAITALLLVGPVLAAEKSLALSPKLRIFAAEWDARDASMRQARNGSVTSITVPQFSVDLADYVNVAAVGDETIECVESYYHIPTVIVQE